MPFKTPEGFSTDAAEWYDTPAAIVAEDKFLSEVKSYASNHRHLSRFQFMRLAEWKSPRLKEHANRNTDDEINEITKISLSAKTERCRITSLLGLSGVSWPMASVILHVCHIEKYPILDVRASGALGFKKIPLYNFDFWLSYVMFCRTQAKIYNVSMRDFDRSLLVGRDIMV